MQSRSLTDSESRAPQVRAIDLYRAFTESKNGFGLSNEIITYFIKGLPTSTPA
jgi:hypothetical protein